MQIRVIILSTLLLATGISAARADDIVYSESTTRIVQLQLAQAGYYHGRIDGKGGPETVAALVAFQHANGLYSNGKLNFTTRDALAQTSQVLAARSGTAASPVVGQSLYATPIAAMRPLEGGSLHPMTQVVASRFGQLDVTQTGPGTARIVTAYYNGKNILSIPGTDLRVSPAYNLAGEDAVLVSVRDDSAQCPARHFLLAVGPNGGYLPAREVGACAASYDANVSQGALLVTFTRADGNRLAGSNLRYQNAALTTF